MSNIGSYPSIPPASPFFGRAVPAAPPAAVIVPPGATAANASPGSSEQPASSASGFPPVNAGAGAPTAEDDPRQARVRQELAAKEAQLELVEQAEIRELSTRDREVRAHEQAHMAVGGQYAGGVSYDYTRGPDGRLYATGGSVSIDISPIAGDPAATINKMQQVQRAALAPAEPSGQDRIVAAQAAQLIAQARAEIAASAGEQSGTSSVVQSDPAVSSPEAESTTDPGVTPSGTRELATYRQIAAPTPDQPALRASA